MSSLQFTGQILLADLVLRIGLAKRRYKEVMSWRQYTRHGAPSAQFSLSLLVFFLAQQDKLLARQ